MNDGREMLKMSRPSDLGPGRFHRSGDSSQIKTQTRHSVTYCRTAVKCMRREAGIKKRRNAS